MPQRLKQRLEGRYGLHIYGGRKQMNLLLNEEDRNAPPARHALVQIHPETGRKLLYFDQGKILRIEGYDQAESDAIIDEMIAYMAQPPDQYRHQWRKGDVVIWDNRCSYHKAAADYPPEEDRIHWRVSIKDHGVLS
ncbi:MAG: TauD/TfdA family dioxygenase [Proteobacteria bacterium]|nr:TauD/TfdA family dioxygenase [Pseudomonadota bacterium]